MPPPPVLMDELVEEVLLRLPPEDPAWFVRSSAVCKPWRRILADPRFRRRYREFHGTPPLLGYFEGNSSFVPTTAHLPAQPHHPGWVTLDCRHGRAIYAPTTQYGETFNFIVVELETDHQSRVPSPVHDGRLLFSVSVLCVAEVCDHHACQGGHFLVALVSTDSRQEVTSGWLYSSETRAWSQLTSLHHTNVKCASHMVAPSVLVGDALYFRCDAIVKCQLGTLSLSVFKKPIDGTGRLMTMQDGGLGFTAVVDATNLNLWLMETGPEGAMGWTKLSAIDLRMLLPDGALSMSPGALVSGFAEGTQVIFLNTYIGRYMVDLKSGRVRTVYCRGENILPYMRFYIQAMDAASTAQGQSAGV